MNESDADDVTDVEIEAYVVQLCRAAEQGAKAAAILAEVSSAFPHVEDERIKRCAASAANRLLEQGEYIRPRRRVRRLDESIKSPRM